MAGHSEIIATRETDGAERYKRRSPLLSRSVWSCENRSRDVDKGDNETTFIAARKARVSVAGCEVWAVGVAL